LDNKSPGSIEDPIIRIISKKDIIQRKRTRTKKGGENSGLMDFGKAGMLHS
jgi:hypothetical protein